MRAHWMCCPRGSHSCHLIGAPTPLGRGWAALAAEAPSRLAQPDTAATDRTAANERDLGMKPSSADGLAELRIERQAIGLADSAVGRRLQSDQVLGDVTFGAGAWVDVGGVAVAFVGEEGRVL